MKVLNLSVEQGVVMGVDFRPVVYGGAWVGEGFTEDPVALARFKLSPSRYVFFDVTVETVPQTEAVETAPAAPETPVEVQEPEGPWPAGFPERAIKVLESAGWTLEDVRAASDAQLEALKGIGPVLVREIKEVL